LQSQGFKFTSGHFRWFLANLRQLISTKGDDDMAFELTSQDRKEMAQFWGSSLFGPEDFKELLETLPPEERIAYLSTT